DGEGAGVGGGEEGGGGGIGQLVESGRAEDRGAHRHCHGGELVRCTHHNSRSGERLRRAGGQWGAVQTDNGEAHRTQSGSVAATTCSPVKSTMATFAGNAAPTSALNRRNVSATRAHTSSPQARSNPLASQIS